MRASETLRPFNSPLKENLMDTLHAAYWVCVAVHVVFWLYGRFEGP